jgi:hypothetical protein
MVSVFDNDILVAKLVLSKCRRIDISFWGDIVKALKQLMLFDVFYSLLCILVIMNHRNAVI